MSPARVGTIAVVATVGPGVTGALLWAVGAPGWAVLSHLATFGAVGAACAVTGVLLRRLTRRSRRFRDDIDARLHALAKTAEAERAATATSLDAVRAELRRVHDQALPRLSHELTQAVARQGRDDYEQQVAWAELRDHLAPAPFMPPLRGWAASPDVLRVCVRLIDARRPALVVECGSGASSVWLGYALRRAGRGRLVALEHEERYAGLSRELVAAHALDDVVEVRHAPLTAWTAPGTETDTSQPWYDRRAIADLIGIGLVFVDGPPAATAEEARYPAVPALLAHCSGDAVFVLDDTARAAERATVARWLTDHPELSRAGGIAAEKGAEVLFRGPPR